MTGNSGKKDDDANALLGDLESIRSLLDESAAAGEIAAAGEMAAAGDAASAKNDLEANSDAESDTGEAAEDGAMDDDVPVLDDVIDGALKLSETDVGSDSQRSLSNSDSLNASGDTSSSDDTGGLSDDLMSALLDDDWRTRAESLLAGARQDIENNREDWQPEYTDELTDALQVRIDATVHDWIGRTLTRHVDDLRSELVDALSDELGKQVSSKLGNSQPRDTD